MIDKKIFDKKNIYLEVEAKSQKEAFKFIASKFVALGFSENEKKCFKGLIKREKEASTGFEEGIAIPHAKIAEITKSGIIVIKFKQGIEWNSIDGSLIKTAISLAIPDKDVKGRVGDANTADRMHLKILSSIARKLVDANFRKNLNAATTIDQIYDLISQVEII